MRGTLINLLVVLHWDSSGTIMGISWDYLGNVFCLFCVYFGNKLGLSWFCLSLSLGLRRDLSLSGGKNVLVLRKAGL